MKVHNYSITVYDVEYDGDATVFLMDQLWYAKVWLWFLGKFFKRPQYTLVLLDVKNHTVLNSG